MEKIPFSVYDFFGYLAPGFLILLVLGFVPVVNKQVNKHLYPGSQGIASESALAGDHDSLLQQAQRNSHRLETALGRNAKLQDTLQKQALAQDGLDNASLVLRALDNHVGVQEALHSNLQFREGLYERARIQKQGSDHFLLQKDLSFALFILWVGVAYVIGHILAVPSAWLLERIVTKRWLKVPSVNLFWRADRRRYTSFFFGHYWTPLPEQMGQELLDKAKKEGYKFPGLDKLLNEKEPEDREAKKEIKKEARKFYLHAYAKVKKDAAAMTLQDRFLALYGFSRNVSFSFLCVSVAPVICYVLAKLTFLGVFSRYAELFRAEGIFALVWFLLCFAACVVMFLCYLKFFRMYYRELFFAYAELSSKKPSVVSALRRQAW